MSNLAWQARNFLISLSGLSIVTLGASLSLFTSPLRVELSCLSKQVYDFWMSSSISLIYCYHLSAYQIDGLRLVRKWEHSVVCESVWERRIPRHLNLRRCCIGTYSSVFFERGPIICWLVCDKKVTCGMGLNKTAFAPFIRLYRKLKKDVTIQWH